MPVKPWKSIRDQELRDPEIASAFLSEVFETGTPDEIVLAVQYVLEANGSKPVSGKLDELAQLRGLGLHLNVSSAMPAAQASHPLI